MSGAWAAAAVVMQERNTRASRVIRRRVGMVVVVFRSRLKPGIEKEVEETDARMEAIARTMPGFVSYSQYASPDGEGVAVVEFESHETAAAWRAHPEHREAQRLGKDRWFADYRITVCDVVRDYSFPK
jgi:heme-degrading monooxygenase HmoA